MLNFDLIKQPLNWLTVWAMLLIAWFAFEFVSQRLPNLENN